MAKFSAAVPLLAVAGLAACASDYTSPPVAATPSATGAIVTMPAATVTVPSVTVAPAPAAVSYRTGFGVVQSVAQVTLPAAQPSASAGGSSVAYTAYRLTVRMDDGTIQTIDQDSRAFAAGDRIQLTPDGHVLRY